MWLVSSELELKDPIYVRDMVEHGMTCLHKLRELEEEFGRKSGFRWSLRKIKLEVWNFESFVQFGYLVFVSPIVYL